MKTTQILHTHEETIHFAKAIAQTAKPGDIIFLEGPLGAGKTTFARGFLQTLGFTGPIKSPTYTLVELYETGAIPVYHFDLYRLEEPEALFYLGIEEYCTPKSICLIEWPEKGAGVLPAPTLTLQFEVIPEGRQVTFSLGITAQ